jgi:hypothetical protein
MLFLEKGYWFGSMPVFNKHSGLNQCNLKSHFLDGPSPHAYCVLEFLATCLVGSNIIGQYTYILTNYAQELTPYRFRFKCDTNRIRKYFLFELTFEPRSLKRKMNTLANSAMLWCLYLIKINITY